VSFFCAWCIAGALFFFSALEREREREARIDFVLFRLQN
jgi:hypothetical protein